jgi:hypothetical protein
MEPVTNFLLAHSGQLLSQCMQVECCAMAEKHKTTIERVHCNKRRSKTQHRLAGKAIDKGTDWDEHVGEILWRTHFELIL